MFYGLTNIYMPIELNMQNHILLFMFKNNYKKMRYIYIYYSFLYDIETPIDSVVWECVLHKFYVI